MMELRNSRPLGQQENQVHSCKPKSLINSQVKSGKAAKTRVGFLFPYPRVSPKKSENLAMAGRRLGTYEGHRNHQKQRMGNRHLV